MRIDGLNVYVDPYEGSYVDKADVVLVSHEHFDHCDPSKIENVRKEETTIIGPPTCATIIIGKIRVIKVGEKVAVNSVTFEAVQAYNVKRFRSPGVPFHPKGSGLGYLISSGGKTVYFAGDTDLIPEMNGVTNVFVAILPIGGTYTMDIPEAAEAASVIKPQFAVPMHPLNSDLKQFKKLVEQSLNTTVVLLVVGEEHEFK
jgi:L-ascorbate metabolism protein UlaG (beta-lactamase superfamily)